MAPTKPRIAVITVSVMTNQTGKWYVNRYIITGIKIPQKAISPNVNLPKPETKLLISPAAKAESP